MVNDTHTRRRRRLVHHKSLTYLLSLLNYMCCIRHTFVGGKVYSMTTDHTTIATIE